MTERLASERERARGALGRVGAWTFAFDGMHASDVRVGAEEIEAVGYPALWIPEGMGSREVFSHASLLLSASRRLAVATGIANIGARHPFTMASGARMLADAFPGRFVLGMGVGHEYQYELRGTEYARPWSRMRAYLEAMERAPSGSPEPSEPAPRMIAALGDRMLELAGERTAGAHTYFVPVEHTARARAVLGADPVLAVELTCVLENDSARARALGRGFASGYLELPNYANNLRRQGFSEQDLAGGGADRLIDATVAWGDAGTIAARAREHLDAGADHVCVQMLPGDDADVGLDALRELAPVLLSV